jgi:hypothetical protein
MHKTHSRRGTRPAFLRAMIDPTPDLTPPHSKPTQLHPVTTCVLVVEAMIVAGFLGAAVTALGGCASTMSATEHRQRAAEEQQLADQHAARYDPGARAAHLDTPLAELSLAPPDYNPTHFENDAAISHAEAARRHLDAAHALEASEDAACKDIPRASRSACPLFASKAIEDIPHGVRLRFADDATAAKAASLARCQQAFARTMGFRGLPSCILYGQGLSIGLNDQSVEIVADDEHDVLRVRSNVRAHHPSPSQN